MQTTYMEAVLLHIGGFPRNRIFGRLPQACFKYRSGTNKSHMGVFVCRRHTAFHQDTSFTRMVSILAEEMKTQYAHFTFTVIASVFLHYVFWKRGIFMVGLADYPFPPNAALEST